jgi:hypothetical protein
VLIRDMLQSGRAATEEEIDQIIRRMAQAPFPTTQEHCIRRTQEGQWAEATTDAQYVDDLRRAIRDTTARLAVYIRRGGSLAAVLAQTERIVPANRRGHLTESLLFVAYSADRGGIITGYQAGGLGEISLPEDVRWLR